MEILAGQLSSPHSAHTADAAYGREAPADADALVVFRNDPDTLPGFVSHHWVARG